MDDVGEQRDIDILTPNLFDVVKLIAQKERISVTFFPPCQDSKSVESLRKRTLIIYANFGPFLTPHPHPLGAFIISHKYVSLLKMCIDTVVS